MDVDAFLAQLRSRPSYANQIVHVHESAPRSARYGTVDLSGRLRGALVRLGIERLYSHQAQTLTHVRNGRNVLVATGTASGKTLCYTLAIIEKLLADPDGSFLLLFPTKALCQDQYKKFSLLLEAAGLPQVLAGVIDGDTPAPLRRRLRDKASVVFSNPDMLHAAIMPQHSRWARFFARLSVVVLDEIHVYSGMFGSNMALLLRRFFRLCAHYGASPQMIACSATVANPLELAENLSGRPFELVDDDGSPRGRRVYVFWNPPRVRGTTWRSRRSANVEAHEIMAALIENGCPTITFSKAKMTAEMIHRYVTERLGRTAPHLAGKVTPYRGGYLPEERREIEKRLFEGELLGVSTTPALELGIDVGSLDACVIVGYPGTLASFFQQSGRAGRKERDAVVFLIGLDTSVNQFIMSHPEYLFERRVEQALIQPENPFVATGHVRCAAQEMALSDAEAAVFGPHAPLVLRILEENSKVRRIGDRWYHASSEIPQHEVSLRESADENVIIQDADSGEALGEINRYDAEPIVHAEAIYMHRGDTYRVLELDLDDNIARVRREDVGYYTQPLGGTDIHHIDHRLREKRVGSAMAYWGEVTAYFGTYAFEKIDFYTLDAVSVHGLELPTMVLETMAFWLVPPESLMEKVRDAGLDTHNGLRGLGYATRMLLPLFITCDTLDFSHTVGSINSPWNAVFIYERFTHGLGFTEKAFGMVEAILPAVLDNIRNCPCESGCPCCVGKPLRQASTWNVERGEGAVPAKASTLMILEGMIGGAGDWPHPAAQAVPESEMDSGVRLERMLRRRLERMREPRLFHPITPLPEVKTEYPGIDKAEELGTPDAARRRERRMSFERELHQRLAKNSGPVDVPPRSQRSIAPRGMRAGTGAVRPVDFPGRPAGGASIAAGDSLAARARRLRRQRPADPRFPAEPDGPGGHVPRR